MDPSIGRRIDDMIADLPGPLSPKVQAALRAVPRHLFVPPIAVADDSPRRVIDRDTDPDEWWRTVYANVPIITQLDDGASPLADATGRATSSTSAPGTVADLLGLLEAGPGQRVLEVGTGTGWTAALLTHLVGETGTVTSIEVDPAVAEQAAKNLGEAGARPRLVVGDGAHGHPGGALYDRVHITCGIRYVPYAWVEQTRPGGVIVLPWCPEFGEDHSLRLVVTPDGIAHGRFPGYASYMLMRSQRVQPWQAGDGIRATSQLDPRVVWHAPPGAHLAIAAITGLRSYAEEDDGELTLWAIDPDTPGRWAAARSAPGDVEFATYQVGDRPLWDEVTDAYRRWVDRGQPGRDRFGMTVTLDGQQVWLDTPEQPIG
ncbi:protein-L-isoaspartate(D-aspartate) O-methyltransferase [Spongiactinospora rosea]|uniref:Protein-L-isoaspartate O-methyltransferase n=1 Tax=Spongiactinospora rosea TaxID=2248750 RepID=A0A366M795_9ACTN|nr:methyltransferase domain-containing protein [Spongiactinospora rosea]RBQ21332.1 protein-L-isoaspartate(D-aspartate) O-methyltransferase [Spongiactinospora rosea]